MELEHHFTRTNLLLPSYEDAEQCLSHDNSHALFSASDNNPNFLDGTEDAEEMNLDFLITDFGTESWTSTKSKEAISSNPCPLEVPMASDACFASPLPSLPSMTPTEQDGSDTQKNIPNFPSTEKTIADPVAIATNDRNWNGTGTRKHLPMLLEITLRLHLKTPSITQSPISETLRLARQGLQVVQQCLPALPVPPLPHAPSSHDASSSFPRSGDTGSESSTILACILLKDKVLLCYETILKQRAGPGSASSYDVSSPALSPAPSPNSTPTPLLPVPRIVIACNRFSSAISKFKARRAGK